MDWPGHLIYAAAWASFGLVHSVLAGEGAKARLRPRLGDAYRLAYNLVAAGHIALVLGLGWWLLGDAPAFPIDRGVRAVLLVIHVAAWAALLLALRRYDLGRLAGTRQLRDGEAGDEEALVTTGIHAYVRHPLYAAAFVVLWSAAVMPLALATALWGSAYLWLGSRFEERRLLARFGEAYRTYRTRVPAFVPWKGRAV